MNISAIIGGIVAALIVIIIITVAVVYLKRRAGRCSIFCVGICLYMYNDFRNCVVYRMLYIKKNISSKIIR